MGLLVDISKKFYHFYPSVVAVIVTSHDKKVNAMPAAWNGGVSFDPKYFYFSVSKKRYTYELLSKSSIFSVNFLDWKYLELVHNLGSVSGRDVDKISMFNVPLQKGILENSFIIPVSYASYECKVIFDKEFGDHNLVVGEVLKVYMDPQLFTEDEKPDLSKVTPIFYLGSGCYVKLSLSELREL